MYPVVKLKRLSFKDWLQADNEPWKRIGGLSDVGAKVNVQGHNSRKSMPSLSGSGLAAKSLGEAIKIAKKVFTKPTASRIAYLQDSGSAG